MSPTTLSVVRILNLNLDKNGKCHGSYHAISGAYRGRTMPLFRLRLSGTQLQTRANQLQAPGKVRYAAPQDAQQLELFIYLIDQISVPAVGALRNKKDASLLAWRDPAG